MGGWGVLGAESLYNGHWLETGDTAVLVAWLVTDRGPLLTSPTVRDAESIVLVHTATVRVYVRVYVRRDVR